MEFLGGTDEIVISPWRHLKEKGSIALDLAVHHTDLISYLGGDFDRAFGGAFISHEVRRKRDSPELDLESYRARHQAMPPFVVATGDDSLVATYRMKSGLIAQYALTLRVRRVPDPCPGTTAASSCPRPIDRQPRGDDRRQGSSVREIQATRIW